MELTLKDRKLINNLPHFLGGNEGYASLSAKNGEEFFNSNKLSNQSEGETQTSNTSGSGDGGSFAWDRATLGGIQLMNMGFLIADATHPDVNEGDLIRKYGTSQRTAGSTVYEAENQIDYGAEMKRISDESRANTVKIASTGALAGLSIGASIGSAGGPIGAAVGAVVGGIGGLIAGGAAKRKALAKLDSIRFGQNLRTQGVHDLAMTQSLRNDFSLQYGNQENLLLYGHAKYGKMPDTTKLKDRKLINNQMFLPHFSLGDPSVNPITKETTKDYLVDTAYGMAIGPQNAWGNKGEWIQSGLGGYLHKIQRGAGDTARLHLEPSDIVYSNSVINPATGNTIAKDVPAYAKAGKLPELLQTQAIETGRFQNKNNNTLMKAKYGKIPALPKFVSGTEWYTNAIPALTGVLAGWLQYRLAKNDDYDQSSVIPADRTAEPLRKLYETRINPLPMIHAVMRLNAATSSDIKRSGGLSIGQKMLANLSLDAQTQANIANAMLKVDTQNQEWQRLAADAEVKAFMDRARLEMQGRQQDRTNAAAAHNAKQQGIQTGIYNIQNAVEQYFANEFKRKQFDANMKLYQEDVANKKAYYDWLMNRGRQFTPPITEPTVQSNLDDEAIAKNLKRHFDEIQTDNWVPNISTGISVPDFANWNMNYLNSLYKKYNSKRRR